MDISICFKEHCYAKSWLEKVKIVVVDQCMQPRFDQEILQVPVDSIEVFEIDRLRQSIRQESPRIAAFGGLYAVNAAKLLISPILSRKNLLETIFERMPQDRKVIVFPSEPALCTEFTGWMLFYEEKIPAYFLAYRPQLRPKHVFIKFDEFVENLKKRQHIYYAIAFDLALKQGSRLDTSFLRRPSFSGYLHLCNMFEKTGPGPLISLLLSISALAKLEILESTKNLVCHLMSGLKRIFEHKQKDSRFLERILDMAYRDTDCGELDIDLREKKLDIYVEHSWSFYSPSFRSVDMSRAEIYMLLKNMC